MSQRVPSSEDGEDTLPDNNQLGDLIEAVQRVGIAPNLAAAQSEVAVIASNLLGAAETLVAIKKEKDKQQDLALASYGQSLEKVAYESENAAELASLIMPKSQTILSNELKADGWWQPAGGLTRGLATSLGWQEECIGWLAVYRAEDSLPFSEKDKLLLEQLARLLGPVLGAAWRINLLEQEVQARDDFLSVASHDLRNPLSSMRGFAQLIVRIVDKTGPNQPLPRDRIHKYVQRVVRQADNLNDLIEKILDFSRILSHRLELNSGVVELNSLISEIVQHFQEELNEQESSYEQEKRHQLYFEATSAELATEFDPPRLTQIISSLISNAIKYSPNGGTITVRLTSQDNLAELSVQDNGSGIAPSKQVAVFERWKTPAEARENGLGVSLFIAADVVHRYNGTLTYDTTLNRGTTFTLKIPMKK